MNRRSRRGTFFLWVFVGTKERETAYILVLETQWLGKDATNKIDTLDSDTIVLIIGRYKFFQKLPVNPGHTNMLFCRTH